MMAKDVHNEGNLCTSPSEFAIVGSKGILLKLGWEH